MHDLDPQDQLDRSSGRFASREEEADLSTLDDDALSTEAKREVLRDQRQERQLRADQQVALIGLLIFSAVGSMAATISGLLDQDAEIVKAGLVALCAIFGGTIYQLRPRG